MSNSTEFWLVKVQIYVFKIGDCKIPYPDPDSIPLRSHAPHMYFYPLVPAPAGTECGSCRRRQGDDSSPKLTEVFPKLRISSSVCFRITISTGSDYHCFFVEEKRKELLVFSLKGEFFLTGWMRFTPSHRGILTVKLTVTTSFSQHENI